MSVVVKIAEHARLVYNKRVDSGKRFWFVWKHTSGLSPFYFSAFTIKLFVYFWERSGSGAFWTDLVRVHDSGSRCRVCVWRDIRKRLSAETQFVWRGRDSTSAVGVGWVTGNRNDVAYSTVDDSPRAPENTPSRIVVVNDRDYHCSVTTRLGDASRDDGTIDAGHGPTKSVQLSVGQFGSVLTESLSTTNLTYLLHTAETCRVE